MKMHAVFPAILGLLLVAGGTYGWRQAQAPTHIYADAMLALAAIEPAAGGGAATEGDHAPKKSHSGKVLSAQPTLPKVTIGSQTIVTSRMLYEQEMADAIPASLQSAQETELLKRRMRFSTYAHNPSMGPEDAPLQLIEMTDLSCVQCMETSKKLDALMEKYPGKVKLTTVHTPVDQFNGVNLPAFYGKVAQRGQVYWAYRKALQTLSQPTPEQYFETLVQSGMDRLYARRLLRTEARRFYRELDADTQLSKSLNLGNPPHVFINGLHVGQNALPLEKLDDVVQFELHRPQDKEVY